MNATGEVQSANSERPNTTDDDLNAAAQTQRSEYERSKLKFIIDGWVSFYKILIPFRIECIEIPFIKSSIWINLKPVLR